MYTAVSGEEESSAGMPPVWSPWWCVMRHVGTVAASSASTVRRVLCQRGLPAAVSRRMRVGPVPRM